MPPIYSLPQEEQIMSLIRQGKLIYITKERYYELLQLEQRYNQIKQLINSKDNYQAIIYPNFTTCGN